MTVLLEARLGRPQPGPARPGVGWWRWGRVVALAAGLAGAALGRVALLRLGIEPLAAGTTFGAILLGIVLLGRPPLAQLGRTHRSLRTSLVQGIAVGVGLVALALAPSLLGVSASLIGVMRPAAPFAAWVAVTLVVVAAEEAILRGVLFDATHDVAGPILAVAVTAVAFALLHVPAYGWQVVPLDVAVGLALGGLRLATGGLLAPIAAHAIADIATWWL